MIRRDRLDGLLVASSREGHMVILGSNLNLGKHGGELGCYPYGYPNGYHMPCEVDDDEAQYRRRAACPHGEGRDGNSPSGKHDQPRCWRGG